MLRNMGPTGTVIKGHVLDCSVKGIERVLKDYDSQLYIRWNPNKIKRWGCWEVRRKPNAKSVKEITPIPGGAIKVIDYVEWDVENNIMDIAFLNYEIMTKLKAMDTWNENQSFFVDRMEAKEQEHNEKIKKAANDELRYTARQIKSSVNSLQEMIRSGFNPAELADHWGKQGS